MTDTTSDRSSLTVARITDALRAVAYPGLTRDLVSFGMVQHVAVCDGRVKIRLALRARDSSVPARIETSVRVALAAIGATNVVVEFVEPAPAPTARAALLIRGPIRFGSRACGTSSRSAQEKVESARARSP
jgi:metal-sulfur cluster biosynthetic enzyme